MFKGNTKNAVVDSTSINLIGTGTNLTGDIKTGGDFRIDGSIKGNVEVAGKLVVGPTGVIEGDVTCANADISGEVKGVIKVNELLALKKTAKLYGDIVTAKISIEPDALFTGTCKMNVSNE